MPTLSKFVSEKNESWEDYLDTSIFAYNTSKHESSKYTPFEVMFGRVAVIPIDINKDGQKQVLHMQEGDDDQINEFLDEGKSTLEAVKANILIAQERQKACYDRKHANPNIFVVGSMVLKKDFRRKKRAGGKLDPSWVGPYTIVKALGRGLYSLQGIVEPSKIISRINGTHLKRYYQVNFKSFIMHECGKCTLEFSIVFNLASSFVLTRNSSTTTI